MKSKVVERLLNTMPERIKKEVDKRVDNLFRYCQSQIEGNDKCDTQCEHCKEYYSPLENEPKGDGGRG